MRVEWTNSKNVTKDITEFVGSLKWSGADTQAARTVEFTLAHDPYDKYLKAPDIKTGDTIKVYKGKEKSPRFVGRSMIRQKTSDIGTIDVTVYDYMHNMIKSTGTYKFKDKTPEFIAKSVCADLKISVGSLIATKTKIKKYFPADRTYYDIIVGAYKKVSKKTGKKYFPQMNGTKFEIIEKGTIVKNYVLSDETNIYESRYEQNADEVVNVVDAYKDDKKVGTYRKQASIKKYGVIRQAVTVDSGKGSTEAKNTLKGLSTTASISALGNWDCIAGRGIQIQDSASGLIGKYWITNDTHTFENGVHKMELDLAFKNVMENPGIKNASKSSSTTATPSNTATSVDTTNTNVASSNAGGVKYIASDKNAIYTASYIVPGSVDDYGHRMKEGVIIAPSSHMLGGTVKISGTGTAYDGKTYKIVKRSHANLINGKVHYTIPMKSQDAAKKFGQVPGKAKYTRGVKVDGTTSKAEQVVRVGTDHINKVKYKMGANNVPGGLSDCSAFTQYCFYKGAGVAIGRTTQEQLSAGKEVQRWSMRRGDLVLFKDTYKSGYKMGVSHVGIMLDYNRFVHCSSSGGVMISNLKANYYKTHFLMGRRIV